jgi:hypothetical protein
MIPHRTRIRTKVAELLSQSAEVEGQIKWATPAADRIYPCRALDLEPERLPVICVYDDKEEITAPSADFPRRILELEVECHATATDELSLDQSLDLLAWAVETVLAHSPRLEGLAVSCRYTGMEKERNGEGNRFDGCVRLSFSVDYRAVPEVDEPVDFLLFYGDYQPAGYTNTIDRVALEPPEE